MKYPESEANFSKLQAFIRDHDAEEDQDNRHYIFADGETWLMFHSNRDVWLCTKLSDVRLAAIQNGKFTLRTAFEQPEFRIVFKFRHQKDERWLTGGDGDSLRITPDLLPPSDYKY